MALQSGLVAVADAPSTLPPAPEECTHSAPITGVLAHEFAHYEGAVGPEGKRRTTTYYGPVIGGLPIQAWYCEECGLLRLQYPDGRTEERHLFPGPQPGLIAEPSPVAPETVWYGMQARVSGLSAQPAYIDQLAATAGLIPQPFQLQLPAIVLPEWDAVTWLVVGGLSAIGVLLFAMGILAVYSFRTPSIEAPLAVIAACGFVGVLLFGLGAVAVRHFFPAEPLSPSVAELARGKPQLDTATRVAVTLLVVAVVGLFAAGILAVYSFATPGAEGPVFLLSFACSVAAAIVKLAASAWHHYSGK